MTGRSGRFLAAVLGACMVLSLSRMTAELTSQTRRAESLRACLAGTEARIAEVRGQRNMSEEEIRQWALHRGLVSPEDVVFFDEGTDAWRTRHRLKNKGG